MHNNQIKERIFLIGCPRSGTTLLQSFLAAHSQVASFPESKFFQRLIYPGSMRTRLGIASKRAKSNLKQFLHDIDREEMQNIFPAYTLFIRQYTRSFVRLLDTLTIQEGKNCWLEKTPAHIQRIEYIEKLVPDSKFIHIIRHGQDVVASLYDVSHKYPEIWHGAWNMDKCVQRWINDLQISSQYSHKRNHLLISYDSLIENPQTILEKICNFIDIPFEESMLENRTAAAKKIIRNSEHWKESVGGVLQKKQSQKFNELFDEQQRKYIINQLKSVEVDKIYQKLNLSTHDQLS
ncbi:sulfotransferase family protein [Mastigocoleus testarum]|uniref:Sulfotransferase n=1 Tax=Mastigocoleus testarum BC008 TaxID=371196 RepID=A0A0V7ZJ02_9CYAN|nr:sulfotransferase [Mastigocoleus testarum]KST64262.1 hypothetical protein BC008_16620 [Mastigocoleus testarum BC008]